MPGPVGDPNAPRATPDVLSYLANELQSGRVQLDQGMLSRMHPSDVNTLFKMQQGLGEKAMMENPRGPYMGQLADIGRFRVDPEDVFVGAGLSRGVSNIGGRLKAGAEALAAGKGPWAALGQALIHTPKAGAGAATTATAEQILADLQAGRVPVSAGQAASNVTPAMSDAEFLQQTGRPRLATMPDNPFNSPFGPKSPNTASTASDMGPKLRTPKGTGPSNEPMPLNVERTRSVRDANARQDILEPTKGRNAAAHEHGGAMGASAEGENVYDAYEEARKLKAKLRGPK